VGAAGSSRYARQISRKKSTSGRETMAAAASFFFIK
jgi:hypothetical protein